MTDNRPGGELMKSLPTWIWIAAAAFAVGALLAALV